MQHYTKYVTNTVFEKSTPDISFSQIVFKTVLPQNKIYLQHIRKYVITDYCTQYLLALSFYLEATHMYLTHVI
jgi:hypothetical protein